MSGIAHKNVPIWLKNKFVIKIRDSLQSCCEDRFKMSIVDLFSPIEERIHEIFIYQQ